MTQVAFNLGTAVSARKSPPRSERLFLGIRLDGDTARRIERFGRGFCAEHDVQGSLRPRELLHMSLHFVGDFTRLPSAIIHGARRASQTVSLPPFDVTLNHVQSFEVKAPRHGAPGRHALVLLGESAPLVELHRSLGSALKDWGFKAADHFTPHVTLLYGGRRSCSSGRSTRSASPSRTSRSFTAKKAARVITRSATGRCRSRWRHPDQAAAFLRKRNSSRMAPSTARRAMEAQKPVWMGSRPPFRKL